MRLYIIRHADPDYANDAITDAGHQEARALAERFVSHGLDRIFCSPLGRARATMNYTAQRLNMAFAIEEWLAEISEWPIPIGGKSSAAWNVAGQSVRCQSPLPTKMDWYTRAPFDQPIFKQRYEQIQRCSDGFLERLGYVREGGQYRVLRPDNQQKIAAFCHGGIGLTWLAHLLEIPVPLMWAGFVLLTTSVTTVLFEEREAGWAVPRCLHLADVSHLYKGELPVQRAGLVANAD